MLDPWIAFRANTRNYGGQSIALYKTRDTTQMAFTINEQDVLLSYNAMCGSDWLKVKYKGELGGYNQNGYVVTQ